MNGIRRYRGDRGFTLAELIVATTMISIVMIGVYTAMHSAVTAWRFGDSGYEQFDDARYALGLMSRELQAIPAGSEGHFIGEDERIEFFTLTPPMNVEDGAAPAIMKVTYRLRGQSGNRGRRLVREEQKLESALPGAPDCEGVGHPERIVLGRSYEFEIASKVESFDIAYYWAEPSAAQRRPSEPPDWVRMLVEHENRKCWGLPAGVRIQLEISDEEASSSQAARAFDNYVVFRGRTAGIPHDIFQRYQSGRY